MPTRTAAAAALPIALCGCVARTPVNPPFPLSSDSGTRVLSTDAARPIGLRWPAVVIGGCLSQPSPLPRPS